MKQIDGKARRVIKYDRMFFWYVPAGATLWIVYGLYAYGWDWLLLTFVAPGILIGIVLGVWLKDVP